MDRYNHFKRLSRRCFGLFWIPFTTMFIGMMGMPEGSYGWAELPLLTRISLVGMALCMACMVGFAVAAQVMRSRVHRRIEAEGVLGDATLVKTWETGTTINEQPVVGMRVEIQPPHHGAFQTEITKLIPRTELYNLRPGTTLRVKYLRDTQEAMLVAFQDEAPSASFDTLP